MLTKHLCVSTSVWTEACFDWKLIFKLQICWHLTPRYVYRHVYTAGSLSKHNCYLFVSRWSPSSPSKSYSSRKIQDSHCCCCCCCCCCCRRQQGSRGLGGLGLPCPLWSMYCSIVSSGLEKNRSIVSIVLRLWCHPSSKLTQKSHFHTTIQHVIELHPTVVMYYFLWYMFIFSKKQI